MLTRRTRTPVEVAAAVLHIAPGYVRKCMREERIDIGSACQMGERWRYLISTKLLAQHSGVPVPEIEEMIRDYRKRNRERKAARA